MRNQAIVVVSLTGLLLAGCGGGGGGKQVAPVSGSSDVQKIATERGLTPDDVTAALKTYTPSGKFDDYLMFASGGHSGQIIVIGLPSMRTLRMIGVFTPEPWQGWGYGVGSDIMAAGDPQGKENRWGDTHHPGLSETNGDYDGQFVFINDKVNARVAVVDLRDWETKQILKNPLAISDHGGAIVTPNTDWIIEGGQYASPLGYAYAPIEKYNESYRGMVTFWHFDRGRGRIVPEKSFAMELPPYWQDLFDAGKRVSDGWVFGNSINTELATGGIERGNAPFEAGVSQRDNDYLHVIDLKRAAEVARAGKVKQVNGFSMIPLSTSIEEGLLFFVPEPKSPHGVDISPDGQYIVVSGKLDPHVTIYDFNKIKETIAAKKWEPDAYGVPVLDFDSVVEAQVEVGLGPLHTQFDDKGYAYTSLFLDTMVARWTLGGPAGSLNPEPDWTLVGKVPVQYNIGHIAAAEGDTVSPDGKYLVAINKWSIDRFFPTGPLLPQNLQLVDIGETGDTMKVLYDMPMGIGEPHYAQIIKADKLKPWTIYPEIGWDPQTQAVDPQAPKAGEEKIVRSGKDVEIFMTLVRSHFNPERVELKKGDRVKWHLTNLERTQDATHGFALPMYNVNLSLEPGETATIEFVADRDGTFPFYCSEFCSALHLEMMGYLLVQP